MSNSVEAISVKYLTTKKLSGGTRKEYKSTVTKWTAWGNGVDVDQINRSHIRDFLDWFTTRLPKMAVPILAAQRIRLEKTSARSCRGPGSKITSRSYRDSLAQSRNGMSLVGTI